MPELPREKQHPPPVPKYISRFRFMCLYRRGGSSPLFGTGFSTGKPHFLADGTLPKNPLYTKCTRKRPILLTTAESNWIQGVARG